MAVACCFPGPTQASECTGDALFQTASDYPVGDNPSFITTADFNEDGIADLAVSISQAITHGEGGSVAILLGQGSGGIGNGAFGSPMYYLAGDQPHGIAVGDFDEDGILDLAVTHLEGDSVAILKGLGTGGVGDGTFGAAIQYLGGFAPFHVVTGDFNSDDITDLAMSNNSAPALSILFGLGTNGVGDGTFDLPVSYPLAALSTGIASGDFDSDGITDLALTENSAGQVAVFLGQGSGGMGDGTFAPALHFVAGGHPYQIAVDDFDEDGIQDLAVTNDISGGGTAILLGNGTGGVGNGTFSFHDFVGSGNSTAVMSADLNGDDITDLIIATVQTSVPTYIATYLGLGVDGVGSGNFASGVPYPVGRIPSRIAASHFDDDVRLDIAVCNFQDDFVSVLLGTCAEDTRPPNLTSVRDVPNDQGGKVFLTWTASSLDAIAQPVTSYRVWRRIPPALARSGASSDPALLRRETALPNGITEITYWEALATLPAQRLEGYGYTAPTTQDSMRTGNPFTAFFVSALTDDIDVFYDSDVDSGYSVDNLPPRGAPWFTGDYGDGVVSLHWPPSTEADFAEFRLYRGEAPDFIPGSDNLISAQSDTGYVDQSTDVLVYKLTVVDTHENESPAAIVQPTGSVAVIPDWPARLHLYPGVPNPIRSHSLIRFDLPIPTGVRLTIFDAKGRTVRAADLGANLPPGQHEWIWDTRDNRGRMVSPGVYFVSLEAGRESATRKLVIVE
jgi:hypothetical protein